ncbi:MAG: hypothetical protein ACT4OG_10625, partial [Alphaproteobacteria bacterium]
MQKISRRLLSGASLPALAIGALAIGVVAPSAANAAACDFYGAGGVTTQGTSCVNFKTTGVEASDGGAGSIILNVGTPADAVNFGGLIKITNTSVAKAA